MIGKLNSRDHAYVLAVDYQTSLFFIFHFLSIFHFFFFVTPVINSELCVTVLPETQDPNN